MKMNWKFTCLFSAAMLVAAGGRAIYCWWPAPTPLVTEDRGAQMYQAMVQMGEGQLFVGDEFADGKLTTLSGEQISISDFVGGKPLVLIFGSFT